MNLHTAWDGTLLADQVILLIYKSAYAPSIIVLRILIWSGLFVFLSSVTEYLLNAIDKQMDVAKVSFLGMLLNILLNLLLIPIYSYVGAAISTVITEFAVLLMMIVIILKTKYTFSVQAVVKDLLKVVISGLIMAVFIIKSIKNVHITLLIVLSALVYFLSLYSFGGLDRKDLGILKNLLIGVFLNRS